MTIESRPIDAKALSDKIHEYMRDCPNATARLTACRAILSMLGDENQTPTQVEFFPDSAKMVPLSINQLKKMVGMPVWVECLSPKKYESPPVGWRIVEKSIMGRIGVWNEESCFAERDYRKDWIAYTAKRIDREAWEPCEWCGEWIGGDCRPREQDAGYKLYAGYCKQVAADDFYEDETEELNYCPICGRPITDQAWAELEKRLRG